MIKWKSFRDVLQAFPHPLARLENKEIKGWATGLRNQMSYLVVEELIWRGLEPAVNRFREQILGLEPLRIGNKRPHLLSAYQVPCLYLIMKLFRFGDVKACVSPQTGHTLCQQNSTHVSSIFLHVQANRVF